MAPALTNSPDRKAPCARSARKADATPHARSRQHKDRPRQGDCELRVADCLPSNIARPLRSRNADRWAARPFRWACNLPAAAARQAVRFRLTNGDYQLPRQSGTAHPITLSRKKPVAQFIISRAFSLTAFLQPRGDFFLCLRTY